MNLPLILAFTVFIGWGTGDIFTTFATRKIGATLTTFWIFFFSFILTLIALPFAPHNFGLITFPLLLLNTFLGILYISSNVLISEALRISSAPLVGVIIQSFPAVVLILSALIFKDKVTPIQIIFISIIFIGVFLASVDLKKLFKAKNIIDKGVGTALISMVFASLYFTLLRIPMNAYGWFLPNFIGTACFPIILLFMRNRNEKFIIPKSRAILISVFLVGLLIRTGDFALNYGLLIPNASSLVAPIASASPILFVTLSFLIFKDKVTKQQISGIITTLIGIVLLATFGV